MAQPMFPSNSNVNKEKIEKKRLEKVTDGKVLKRKKSLGKKFVETFISEDIGDVKTYIIEEVLIPAAKDTILDGMEMLLLGKVRNKNKNGRVVNYDRIYSNNKSQHSNPNKARMNFDDVIFESRAEAEEVLTRMVDAIETFGMVTIADLYDLAGITGTFQDHKWGWENLSSANVSRVREGYLLNLPKATYLD